jgi:DNA-binding response OmpR family regulator
MPEMDGLDLAKHILAERSRVRVLLMSGLPNVPSRLPLIRKPFRMVELLERVANLIDGPPLDQEVKVSNPLTGNTGF